jgi:hypothetical protein
MTYVPIPGGIASENTGLSDFLADILIKNNPWTKS